MFIVDYNKVKNNEKPIFCILEQEVNDGGTKIYLGLGYKVIDFNTLYPSSNNFKVTNKESLPPENNTNAFLFIFLIYLCIIILLIHLYIIL